MNDKYVLITGGTGGLGVNVTLSILAAGAKQITLPYRSPKSVEETFSS